MRFSYQLCPRVDLTGNRIKEIEAKIEKIPEEDVRYVNISLKAFGLPTKTPTQKLKKVLLEQTLKAVEYDKKDAADIVMDNAGWVGIVSGTTAKQTATMQLLGLPRYFDSLYDLLVAMSKEDWRIENDK
jgi:hypothetical protein